MKRREWKKQQSNVTIDINGMAYHLEVIHSGYDDPGRPMTLDADDAEPPECEVWIDQIVSGHGGRDDEDLSAEELLEIEDEHNDEICAAILHEG